MKYPKEAQVFRMVSVNDHWNESIVEMVAIEQSFTGFSAGRHLLWHHCADPHLGVVWDLSVLCPLTPTAREMLAIARGRR